ncbi:MAG: hypothetical protein E6Q34_04425 [Burkholderiaceae bacterium]|nr:MAG: hypothetical protein E6Q34_04425 [Burkholderiaceae bacterium]
MKKLIAILLACVVPFSATAENTSDASSAYEWMHIRAWLKKNYTQHLALLNPSATDKNIESAQVRLGYSIPSELIAVLKINNGESLGSQGLFGTWKFLSIEDQVKEYKILLADDRFPRRRYLPFLISGGGDYYCIDLSNHKVIEWSNELGMNGVRASGFAEFLRLFSTDLKKGRYIKVHDIHGLVDKEDL